MKHKKFFIGTLAVAAVAVLGLAYAGPAIQAPSQFAQPSLASTSTYAYVLSHVDGTNLTVTGVHADGMETAPISVDSNVQMLIGESIETGRIFYFKNPNPADPNCKSCEYIAYDSRTGQKSVLYKGDSWGSSMSLSGNYFAITDKTETLNLFSANGALVRVIAKHAFDPVFSGDGKFVAYWLGPEVGLDPISPGRGLVVEEVATGRQVQFFKDTRQLYPNAISSDASTVYYTTGNAGVQLIQGQIPTGATSILKAPMFKYMNVPVSYFEQADQRYFSFGDDVHIYKVFTDRVEECASCTLPAKVSGNLRITSKLSPVVRKNGTWQLVQ